MSVQWTRNLRVFSYYAVAVPWNNPEMLPSSNYVLGLIVPCTSRRIRLAILPCFSVGSSWHSGMNHPHSESWFMQIDGVTAGPYSSRQLRVLIKSGRVTPDTPVRKGSGGAWVRVSQLRLKSIEQTAVVPPARSIVPAATAAKHESSRVAVDPPAEISLHRKPFPTLFFMGFGALVGCSGLLIAAVILASRWTPASRHDDASPISSIAADAKSVEQQRHDEEQAQERHRHDEEQSRMRRQISEALDAEEHFVELVTRRPPRARAEKPDTNAAEFLQAHFENPLVLRLAAIDALRRSQDEEADRLAKECLKVSETNPPTHPLHLPDEALAEVHLCLAVTALKQGRHASAFRSLKAAASLDSDTHGPIVERLRQAIEETMPTPECLALAKDVTNQRDIASKPGIDINIEGTIVVQVPVTDVTEELRVEIKRLFNDQSVLVEYEDPLTGSRRTLLFPFKTVSDIYPGVESEKGQRLYALGVLGYDTCELDIRLGQGNYPGRPDLTRGYTFLSLSANIVYDTAYKEQEERRRKASGRLVHFSKSDTSPFQWGTAFVAVDNTTCYSQPHYPYMGGGAGIFYYGNKPPASLIAKWQEMKVAGKRYPVPFTWTRSYGRVYRAASKKGHIPIDAETIASPFLNLPDATQIPYKKQTETFLDPAVSLLKLANRVDAASQQANRVNGPRTGVFAETSTTLELAKLYVDLPPAEQQKMLNSACLVARTVQEVIRFGMNMDTKVAKTDARTLLAKGQAPNATRWRIKGVVLDPNRKLVPVGTMVRVIAWEKAHILMDDHHESTDVKGEFNLDSSVEYRFLEVRIGDVKYYDEPLVGSVRLELTLGKPHLTKSFPFEP